MEQSHWDIDDYGPENSQEEGAFEALDTPAYVAEVEIYLQDPPKDQYYYDSIYNSLYYQQILEPLQQAKQ